jgi:hypothetical protein
MNNWTTMNLPELAKSTLFKWLADTDIKRGVFLHQEGILAFQFTHFGWHKKDLSPFQQCLKEHGYGVMRSHVSKVNQVWLVLVTRPPGKLATVAAEEVERYLWSAFDDDYYDDEMDQAQAILAEVGLSYRGQRPPTQLLGDHFLELMEPSDS